MKNISAAICVILLASSAHADGPARYLDEAKVLIGDPAIGSFAGSTRAQVIWSDSAQGKGLDASFAFQGKGGASSARLAMGSSHANADGVYSGTLTIGSAEYPATIRISPKTCGGEGCWEMAEATASNVDGETVSVLISGQ